MIWLLLWHINSMTNIVLMSTDTIVMTVSLSIQTKNIGYNNLNASPHEWRAVFNEKLIGTSPPDTIITITITARPSMHQLLINFHLILISILSKQTSQTYWPISTRSTLVSSPCSIISIRALMNLKEVNHL